LDKAGGFEHRLVHTGQHYDQKMSDVFFRDLSIPEPDIDLGVGSGSHAFQTGQIMMKFEGECEANRPDLVVVVGDVNSTMACTLVASKMHIPVAHVEAGLRSFDRTMPEEVNRLVTDALADLLFTTSRDADMNLQREGVDKSKIHFVGNVMIDTLMRHRKRANELDTAARFDAESGNYAIMTLHRPANVDDPIVLRGILDAVRQISESLPVIFPIHPRTSQRIREFELDSLVHGGVRLSEPLGYLEFLNLTSNARFAMTDSRGAAGRNNDSGCTVPDSAREHGTASHDIGRNQRISRIGSGHDPRSCRPNPVRPVERGQSSRILGREGGRTDCAGPFRTAPLTRISHNFNVRPMHTVGDGTRNLVSVNLLPSDRSGNSGCAPDL
jgi:UDP-N-acetylglucosamine 2-epimerase (non-hydrolysing)